MEAKPFIPAVPSLLEHPIELIRFNARPSWRLAVCENRVTDPQFISPSRSFKHRVAVGGVVGRAVDAVCYGDYCGWFR